MIIVMDCGTSCIRVGYAGSSDPQVECECLVPRGRNEATQFAPPNGEPGTAVDELAALDELVRDYVTNCTGDQYLMRSIQHLLWNKAIHMLTDNTSGKHLRISRPTTALTGFEMHRNKNLLEWCFEEHNFDSVTVVPEATLGMNAHGCDTGIYVDIGAVWTRVVPVFQNTIVSSGSAMIPLGGAEISSWLRKFVEDQSPGVMISSKSIREQKEKNCFASLNFQRDFLITRTIRGLSVLHYPIHGPRHKEMGRIDMSAAAFLAPETLFCASLNMVNSSVQNAILDTLVS